MVFISDMVERFKLKQYCMSSLTNLLNIVSWNNFSVKIFLIHSGYMTPFLCSIGLCVPIIAFSGLLSGKLRVPRA